MSSQYATLLLLSGSVALVFAVSLILFGIIRYRFSPIFDMGIASLLFAFRSWFYLLQDRLPPVLVILPIMAIGFEVILIYRAISGSVSDRPMRRGDIPVFLGFMVLGFLSGFAFGYSLDQVVHSLYIIFFFGKALVITIQAWKEGRVSRAILSILQLYILSNLIVRIYRAVYFMLTDVNAPFYTHDPRSLSVEFFALLMVVVGNISVFVISITRTIDDVTDERDFARSVVSVIGHDVRSYVSSARMASEMVVHREDPMLPLIDSNLVKAANVLTDLVCWGKARLGEETRSTVLPEGLIRAVLGDIAPVVAGKSVTIAGPDSIPGTILQIDETAATVVLRNVLSNAVKFSPPDGTVSLEVLRNDRTLTVAVSDTGPGFSSDVIRAIRSGSATVPSRGSAGEKGMGVGLRIVRTLCRSYGWSLNIEPRGEAGSVVSVGFPITGDT